MTAPYCKATILVGCVLVLAGCMSVPVAELNRYKQAFGEAQNVSETILLEYDQTLQAARRRVESVRASHATTGAKYAFPGTLPEFSEDSGTKDEGDILVRKQALEVIGRYNQVLTLLASNESVQEIRSSTQSFGNAVTQFAESVLGSSMPGAEGMLNLAKTITGQIEKARVRREFKAAVQAGGPLVEAILSLFIEDANDHYRLAATLYNERGTLTIGAIVEHVGAMLQLFSEYSAPGDDFLSLTDRAVEVNTLLAPLENILPGAEYPYKFESGPPAAGLPVYTAMIDTEINSQIRGVKALLAKYQSDKDAVMALGAALKNYQSLLNAAKTSIESLRQALDRPQSLDASVDELLSLSFEVRRDIETIRSASAAVH